MAGTSGKVQQGADEDTEGISSEAHGQAIAEALGDKRRNEVPAAPCWLMSLQVKLILVCSGTTFLIVSIQHAGRGKVPFAVRHRSAQTWGFMA